MPDNVFDQLRTICLVLPEAREDGEGVGSPAFKVSDKIFAMKHGMDGRPSMWCKAQHGFQAVIVDAQPERFFVPPYVGRHGWIGFWLDGELDWELIADLINESYRMTAPKRLVKLLDERKPGGSTC